MSTIYGIYTGYHSQSISLVKDGQIVNCLEEERMARIKAGDRHDGLPELSLKKMEEITGLKFEDADYRMDVYPHHSPFAKEISNGKPYEVLSHQTAHCAGAYFTSGMEGKVLTLSYDGGGHKHFMKVFLCEDGKMTEVYNQEISNTGSLPHVWAFVTSGIMGYDEYMEGKWKMCKDEGKLMGMAPEGQYDDKIYNILSSVIKYDNLKFYPSGTAEKTRFVIDSMLYSGFFETQKQRENVSFNLQKITEDLMIQFFNDLHDRFPEYTKISVAGGLFANVKLNQKINELPWLDEMYVYPPMGDEGLSLGAALWKANQIGELPKPLKLKNVSFGPSYDDDVIEQISKEYDFIKHPLNLSEIANDINDGKIIGWFDGGMELGPRALGNRSILVRPTQIQTHRALNVRLSRYDTMPFAPMILEDYFDDVFTCSKSKYSSQFMTICYSTKNEWIDKIPAVVQKSDKTARPQIISSENNPKIHELMSHYKELSGIPLILNTSFNTHGEPIIENPHHAFRHLKNKVVDKLVMGNYVYKNR
jgi:carbamoyltransferase